MASSTNLRLRSNVAQYESSGGVQPESFASKVVATRSKLIVMFVFLDSTFKKYIFCDSENSPPWMLEARRRVVMLSTVASATSVCCWRAIFFCLEGALAQGA